MRKDQCSGTGMFETLSSLEQLRAELVRISKVFMYVAILSSFTIPIAPACFPIVSDT